METNASDSCPFCLIARHELPAEVIREDDEVMALLDLYPATTGHVLVIPKRHIENIYGLPADLGAKLMTAALGIAGAIKRQLSPDGLNLVQSNGSAGGQTIPHLHLHIVPRYHNDGVRLQFGHGVEPAPEADLRRIASLIRSALDGQ